ncbi:MAG TPA: hypothetical protein VGB48_00685 [Allosphingosinicella sp.]
MLRQGHRLALYCYRKPQGVPAGVELRDAAAVLPESAILRHQSGSIALFSDRFRYELQRRGAGTWVDTDVYLLKPLPSEQPYLFGEEEPGVINTGVLRLPPDSPLIPPLLALFDEKTVPFWLPLRPRAAALWRLKTGGRSGLSRMPWGSAGPRAITALAKRDGSARLAFPAEVLHPVPWQDAAWIRNPQISLEEKVTERTVSLHLWNERIKHFKEEPAPPGSFLARLQAEGAAAPQEASPRALAG